MKTAKLLLAVLCAFVCTVALTVAASASAIYVSASGSDANDGLSEATPVATYMQAQTIAANNESIETIYIMGAVSTNTANHNIGVAGRTISILGYDSSAELTLGSGRPTLVGDVIIDDLKLKCSKSYGSIVTKGCDLTLGENVTYTGTYSNFRLCAVFDGTANESFDEPAVVTYNMKFANGSNSQVFELGPVNANGAATTWNGWIRYDIAAGARANVLYGSNNSSKAMTVNGIVEYNTAATSAVPNLYLNGNAADLTSHGLRSFNLNGTVTNVYLSGSPNRDAVAGSTGVAVFTFGSQESTSKFYAKGIENETDVTHVLIFNNRDSIYDRFVTAETDGGWAIPNEYVFQVDATGSVEAYMSKLPTAEDDLECIFGGIELISTYSHAVIDEGTANEQIVDIASLTDGKYPVANIAEGTHTVTFRDIASSDPVTFDDAAATGAAGYVAETRDASEKTYAIIASFKLDTFDSTEVTSFGAYYFDADNDEANIVSSNVTALDGTDGRFYVMIYGIGTPDTSVAVKPYAAVGSDVYYGTVLDIVPTTVGCDTYYGPETAVVDYFA